MMRSSLQANKKLKAIVFTLRKMEIVEVYNYYPYVIMQEQLQYKKHKKLKENT